MPARARKKAEAAPSSALTTPHLRRATCCARCLSGLVRLQLAAEVKEERPEAARPRYDSDTDDDRREGGQDHLDGFRAIEQNQ